MQEVDAKVFVRALAGRDQDDLVRILRIATLGNWTDFKLAQFQPENNGNCAFCGEEHGDFIHLAWHCPSLEHCRYLKHDFLRGLNLECTPPHILLGIPSAMEAEGSPFFFGSIPDNQGYIHYPPNIAGLSFLQCLDPDARQ